MNAEQDREHQVMSLGLQPATRYLNQRDRVLMYQLNQYYLTKATARSKAIAKSIHEVVKVVHDVLRELEIQEPRFISTFTENNGHYDGESDQLYRLEPISLAHAVRSQISLNNSL